MIFLHAIFWGHKIISQLIPFFVFKSFELRFFGYVKYFAVITTVLRHVIRPDHGAADLFDRFPDPLPHSLLFQFASHQ